MWNQLGNDGMEKDKHCGCNPKGECEAFSPLMEVTQLARAYVPNQHMCQLYSGKEGLKNGTIFPELDQPYCYACKVLRKEDELNG